MHILNVQRHIKQCVQGNFTLLGVIHWLAQTCDPALHIVLRHTATSGSAKFGEVAVLHKTFSRLGLVTACDRLWHVASGFGGENDAQGKIKTV